MIHAAVLEHLTEIFPAAKRRNVKNSKNCTYTYVTYFILHTWFMYESLVLSADITPTPLNIVVRKARENTGPQGSFTDALDLIERAVEALYSFNRRFNS